MKNKILLFSSKELNKNDYKISISILSIFVVLMIQYFILYYFNIVGTKAGAIIQLISKLIVGLFFIRSFFVVLKRKANIFIMIYLLFVLIIVFNYWYFKESSMYLKSIWVPLFTIGLPSFIYSMSIKDIRIFRIVLEKVSLIIYIVGMILGLLQFFKRISLGGYSMTMGYYLLLPTIIYIEKFLEKPSIKTALISLSSVFIMLAIGSRGPILCIGIYVIMYKVITLKRMSRKNFLLGIGILPLVLTGIIYYKRILLILAGILDRLGIESRSIRLFLETKIHLSGRGEIYQEIIRQIKIRPFLGIGLAGDRFYVGQYTHNIIIEIISGFGIIIGTIIIMGMSIIIIRSLFLNDIDEAKIILIWFAVGLIPLMISGSYLISFQFWIFMGLAIRKIKIRIGSSM